MPNFACSLITILWQGLSFVGSLLIKNLIYRPNCFTLLIGLTRKEWGTKELALSLD